MKMHLDSGNKRISFAGCVEYRKAISVCRRTDVYMTIDAVLVTCKQCLVRLKIT
jgi:hypothetical protein